MGTLVAGHGVSGLARIKPFNPASPALTTCRGVWLTPPGEREPTHFEVTEVRPHRGLFLARLARITTLDALLPWMQSRVDVDRADLPSLGEGEIYHFEAIGLEVRTVSGEMLGTIVEIMALPANDVWVVRGSDEHGRELLVPAVGTIIREIDLGKRIAVIDPPTGLFDD